MKNKGFATMAIICITLVALAGIIWTVLSTWDWNKLFDQAKQNADTLPAEDGF